MSESNNVNQAPKGSAKKTFFGLLIFAIVCMAITCACIYMTLENKTQPEESQISKEERKENTKTKKYESLKLVDKARMNNIKEITREESFGEIIDYYEYNDTTTRKLEISYVQIDGLKNKEVQDKINEKIKDTVNELKEELVPRLKEDEIERMWITITVSGNFSDVLSLYVDKYIFTNFADDDYENDISEEECIGLNFSLATGEEIKFTDMFWPDSPIKTILSQSLYKDLAWDYAFNNDEDYNWDWDMDHLDYSGVESKVYNFMAKYNKNQDLNFYFTPSSIQISKGKSRYADSYSIDMADYYEYIAIYTKYLSSENLYENTDDAKEFYVFGNPYVLEEIEENGKKADNIYYTIYNYDNLEEMSEEALNAWKAGKKALNDQIDEYVKQLKQNKDKGYIIEAFYLQSEYQEYEWDDREYGYSLDIDISECDRDYFDNHLEDALAAAARAPRVDVGPITYEYIDDNFAFYETYTEWMNDYTDESRKESNKYTKEEREADMARWEAEEEV